MTRPPPPSSAAFPSPSLANPPPATDPATLLDQFLSFVRSQSLQLYPAQESAILELFDGKNVILNTPTGSGKSLVAAALHYLSKAQGRRSVYTSPVKALVNEKWLALCQQFGPANVGLSTGDASVNTEAPILCCTAEVLANLALRMGDQCPFSDVILDEFHFYSDASRGVAWQIPLLTLPHARFLLMSATLGDPSFFQAELTRLTGKNTALVTSTHRPVPLDFEYAETPLLSTLESLLLSRKAPVYVVHFTQLEAARNAGDFMSLPLCSKLEKAALSEALQGFHFSSPYGSEIRRWIRHGIGIHHAGLLPKYRLLIEQLAQRGLLKVICGTDTLGVGVNIPIRTVLFTQLCKFSGEKTALLSARDFHQISGRAGRKGFDSRGWVVVQAPAHVIENQRLEKRQSKTGKRFVKRKPPERNFVAWDRTTFERLIVAPPERLKSRFEVSPGLLLNVLSRPDGIRAMRQLIRDSHESRPAKKAHRKRAWQLFRSLVKARIIEIAPPQASPQQRLIVNTDLQQDFSLNRTLSLYLNETLDLIDPNQPDYALRVLSLAESILEDPLPILRSQLDQLKGDAIAEMKSQGLDYEQRLEQLEQLEHPKPDREFLYASFNAFAEQHPWVGSENVRPKSIAREMFETYQSFPDYIKRYDLERVEGLLLRHLSDVYKVLSKSVPDSKKDAALQEIEVYLGNLIREVDSSLLEHWETMRNPSKNAGRTPAGAAPKTTPSERSQNPLSDSKALETKIRDTVFRHLRLILSGQFESAFQMLATGTPASHPLADFIPTHWVQLEALWAPYFDQRGRFRLDPAARNRNNTRIADLLEAPSRQTLSLEQILVDPDEQNDWIAAFEIPLAPIRTHGEVHLVFLGVHPSDQMPPR